MDSHNNQSLDMNSNEMQIADTSFYVVAVGASAGGLKPLEVFFENIHPDAGVAFVVIQHLSPDFKSLMNEILGRRTKLTIHIAEEGMELEPNAIYLIPAGQNMIVRDHCLYLYPQKRDHKPNFPINLFFQSLAEEIEERAIGIVLSGTGSDGTHGLQNIHEGGGITLVQDPDTAEFDGMPHTAISTGCIDYIAPPKVLADMINDLGNSSLVPADLVKFNGNLGTETHQLQKIVDLLAKHEGIDFSQYKLSTLGRRVERRRLLTQHNSLHDYATLLTDSADERSLLRRDLLINVTQFFRDAVVWEYLKDQILRPLIKDFPKNETLRVWVTACATGEEAYSMAITIRELCEELGRQIPTKLFATDLDQTALDKAAMGVFDESIADYVGEDRLRKYFTYDNGHFTIKRMLREMLIFSPHDLTKNASLTRMNVVTCRNVLIYMQPILQQYVLRNLHFSLNKGGILLLGNSEDLGEVEPEFEILHAKNKIFSKVREQRLNLNYFRNKTISTPVMAGREARHRRQSDPLLEHAFKAHLEELNITCLLLDTDEKLLRVCADHLDILRIPEGPATENVRSLLPEVMHLPFISALNRVLREKQPVQFNGLLWEKKGEPFELKFKVSPCQLNPREQLFLKLEISTTTRNPVSVPQHDVESSTEVINRIEQLELELSYSRENLQATIEELESTNEEQQATNEELIASNEELQSTNEELHAVNEELYTVNNEHQSKINELTALSNDIDNLFRSTEIGVVFLDQSLQVRKFTPAANQIFQFLPSDVGRPLKNLASNVNYPSLLEVLSETARTGKVTEQEIHTDEKHLLIRIHPYLNNTDEQQGVVMSIIDITTTRQVQIELQSQRIKAKLAQDTLSVFQERYQRLYHETPVMMYSLNAHGVIIEVSNFWLSKLGYPRNMILGATVDIFFNSESQDRFQKLWPRFLESGLSIDVPMRIQTKSGEIIDVLQSMIAERDDLGDISRCLVVSVDISQRKLAESARLESEQRFRSMADHAPVQIWLTDVQGQCTYLNEEWLRFTGSSLEQALDHGWREGIHPEDVEESVRAYQQAISERQPFRLEYRRCDRNDTYSWILDTAKPRFLPTGEFAGMIGSCIDISLQKQAEAALEQSNLTLTADLAEKDASLNTIEGNLQESETRFYSLADNAPVLIWLSDAQGRCTYVNQTWESLTGQSLQAQLGEGWLNTIHPEDRDRVQTLFQKSCDQQCSFEQEFRQARADGVYRWILATGVPRVAADRFSGLICSCMDISDIKHSQKRLEQAIQELQRSNQELEQFAYIASHDLREPLRKIQSFAELLQDDLAQQLDQDQSRYFGYIMSGAERMQCLIQDVLQYSRVGRSDKALESVALNYVLDIVQSDLSLAIEESQAVIEFESLPSIYAHTVEVTQVFENIINNAIKFRSETPPRIHITAEQQSEYWEISISDNGIGIPEDSLERIFVMFQRLHNPKQYPGTGIGLALCRKVIESYGGTLTCTSTLGEGTTFIIKLPLQPMVPILQYNDEAS
ncbi:PAS domain S-box protein [Acaryochloris marina NIES-2412]|uniref:PAS domain S-box protein n=1 Tax=Acaryochloris marina TaxID=155978 RepID=UPI0040580586